ncbi:ATP-binding cassette domain-containing protein [Streptomyces sp. NPDC054864]
MIPEECTEHSSSAPNLSLYALEMDRVSKSHGTGPRAVPALCEVTLGLARGGVTAVIGSHGSGKSTLLACATGRQAPASGWVTVHDRVGTHPSDAWAALPAADAQGPELLVADDLDSPAPLYAATGRQDPDRTFLVTTGSPIVAAAADIVLFLVQGRLVDAMCDAPAAEIAAQLEALTAGQPG